MSKEREAPAGAMNEGWKGEFQRIRSELKEKRKKDEENLAELSNKIETSFEE